MDSNKVGVKGNILVVLLKEPHREGSRRTLLESGGCLGLGLALFIQSASFQKVFEDRWVCHYEECLQEWDRVGARGGR